MYKLGAGSWHRPGGGVYHSATGWSRFSSSSLSFLTVKLKTTADAFLWAAHHSAVFERHSTSGCFSFNFFFFKSSLHIFPHRHLCLLFSPRPLPLPLVSRQVVLRRVGGERVGVLIVRVLAAVVGRRLARQGDAGIVVGVDGLAEVDGVLEFLLQHLLAGVARQLEQEEARVGLWQEVIGRVVFVQHLKDGERKRRGRKESEIEK